MPEMPTDEQMKAFRRQLKGHMNDLQRETPRTNAAWDDGDPLRRLSDNERREFAAQLERELAVEQRAHDTIASLCFAAGAESGDGTSVSAVKSLCSELATLRANLQTAQALADYAEHAPTCPMRGRLSFVATDKCDCGLNETLAQLTANQGVK